MIAIKRLEDDELVIMGLFSDLNSQSFEIRFGENGTIEHSGCLGTLSTDDGLLIWSSIMAMVTWQLLGLYF